ncbi:head GIN domain-containing protein [soil metagenome]
MRNLVKAISIIVCVVNIIGCGSKDIVGKDQPKSEIRNVTDFNAVNISGSYNVVIQVGANQNVSVTSNPNLLPYITTHVKGNTLYVDHKSSFALKPTGMQTINITVKNVKQIELDGANSLDAQGINSDDLTLKFNGTTKGGLAGIVKDVKLATTGDANIDAQKLVAEKVKVDISGSANIMLNVTKKIDATIMGSGKVQYIGKPQVSQKIMGSGEITEAVTAPAAVSPATTPPAKSSK